MAITVTVSLVGTTSPQQVQIDVGGTTAGDIVSIAGQLDTFGWAVRGATEIVATGSQVLRRDNLAPVNAAFTYIVTVNAVQYESAEITVPYSANYVLTALDGADSVDFTWLDNDAPVDIDFHQHFTTVPGRDTDVMRYSEGGVESGEYLVQTDKHDTLALRTILRKGAPVVLRTNGSVRDIPAVAIVGVYSAHRELRRKGGNSTDRNWLLSWRAADDPQATFPVSGWTFADFDAAIALSLDGELAAYDVRDDTADGTAADGYFSSGDAWAIADSASFDYQRGGLLAGHSSGKLACVDVGSADVAMSGLMYVTGTSNTQQIAFRILNNNNCLTVRATSDTAPTLTSRITGTGTDLTSGGSALAIGLHSWRVRVEGDQVDVWFDDELVIDGYTLDSATQTALGSNTYHGSRCTGANASNDAVGRFFIYDLTVADPVPTFFDINDYIAAIGGTFADINAWDWQSEAGA